MQEQQDDPNNIGDKISAPASDRKKRKAMGDDGVGQKGNQGNQKRAARGVSASDQAASNSSIASGAGSEGHVSSPRSSPLFEVAAAKSSARAATIGGGGGVTSPALAHEPEEDEAAKLEAKREYNRRNAARARARTKEMVARLQEKVAMLTEKSDNLAEENKLLKDEVRQLRQEKVERENRGLFVSNSTDHHDSTPRVILPEETLRSVSSHLQQNAPPPGSLQPSSIQESSSGATTMGQFLNNLPASHMSHHLQQEHSAASNNLFERSLQMGPSTSSSSVPLPNYNDPNFVALLARLQAQSSSQGILHPSLQDQQLESPSLHGFLQERHDSQSVQALLQRLLRAEQQQQSSGALFQAGAPNNHLQANAIALQSLLASQQLLQDPSNSSNSPGRAVTSSLESLRRGHGAISSSSPGGTMQRSSLGPQGAAEQNLLGNLLRGSPARKHSTDSKDFKTKY